MSLQKGFALITVLAMAIVISLGAATVLRSMGNIASMKSNIIADIQSQYLAEAGTIYAAWQCRTSGGVCPASTARTIDGTVVTVTATTLTPTTFYALATTVSYADL